MYTQGLNQFFESKRQSMINDIEDLLKVPSIFIKGSRKGPDLYGKANTKALELFMHQAQHQGLQTKNYANKLASAEYGPETRGIDFITHSDVAAVENNWTITNPFDPLVKDNNIYGRGTADDKGPTIATLYAISALKTLNIPLKKGVRLVVGAHEESGERDELKYYFDHEQQAQYTITPDAHFPIVNIENGSLRGKISTTFSEPVASKRILKLDGGTTRGAISGHATATVLGVPLDIIQKQAISIEQKIGVKTKILQQKDEQIELEFTGKTTHVGAPERGNNAVTGALTFLCSLPLQESTGLTFLKSLLSIFPHGDFRGQAAEIARSTTNSGQLLCTLNILHYSERSITGSFDCKLPVGCTEINTKDILLKKLAAKNICVENCEFRPAHFISLDSPLAQTLLKNYQQYTGNQAYGIFINGETYVHEIDNGVACGCMMPGIDNHLHIGDEFVRVNDLLTSAKIYAKTIVDLCS